MTTPAAAASADEGAVERSGTVGRAALAYAVAAVIGRASGLAVVPLLFALPLDEVGAWSVAMAVRSLTASGASFSLDTFLTQRFYATPPAQREALARACLARCLRWNLALAPLAAPLLAYPGARMATAMAWSGQAVAVVNTALAAARIREDPRAYLALSVPPGLATIGACVALVLWAHLGAWGLVIGVTAPWMVAAAALVPVSLRAGAPADHAAFIRRVHAGRMLGDSFGQADRLILGAVLAPSELGVYELGARLASPAALAWSSAKAALMADALRRLADDGRVALSRMFVAAWSIGAAIACATLCATAAIACAPGRAKFADAAPLLCGAIAAQAWLFTQSYYGTLVYHLGLIGTQAWLPIFAIAATVASGWIGALAHGAAGAVIGFVAAQAATTAVTARVVANRWRDRPRATSLVAATAALTITCAIASLTPLIASAIIAGASALAAIAAAAILRKAPRPDAHPVDG